MSSRLIPLGTLPRRILPDLRTRQDQVRYGSKLAREKIQTQWNGGRQDNYGNRHAHGRVRIVTVRVCSKPNHQSRNDHADVIRSVAQYVNEDTQHAEIVGLFGGPEIVVAVVVVQCKCLVLG